MAWQDRHYHREEYRPSFSMQVGRWSVVVWLLVTNIAVFLIELAASSNDGPAPKSWGAFSVEMGIYRLQIWRWVTYQFQHDSPSHLLFNMIGLYFFGPMMERWWGSRRFLWFYLLCGLGAAALYALLSFVIQGWGTSTPLVGASGCIFGILVGCAVLYPNHRVMLMIPPIPLKMRTLVMFIVGAAVVYVLFNLDNAGGEAAHLGGAAVGWLLIQNPDWLNGPIQRWLDKWRGAKRDRHQRRVQKEDAQVNQILDKVRQHGLASLTSREKKMLQEATDRQRRVG